MKSRRYLTAFAVLAIVTVASAQSTPKTFAIVNGEAITEDQVMKAAASDLTALEGRKAASPGTYDRDKLVILHKALDGLVEEKLIAAEAARDKVTRAQIIDAEIDSNIAIPSPAEVEEFYQANKSRIDLKHDDALPQVKQYLIEQQRNYYRNALVYGLKKQFSVKILLDPVRTDVVTSGYPSRGPDNAVVTIVEFSDFECPFCGGLFPTLKTIEKNYAESVRLVYRQFPLTSMHPQAQKAAEASLCANDQKRFWDFHDSMFGDQQHLTVDDLKKRAVDLKLNAAAFNSCLDSGSKVDAVKKDIDEGHAVGVSGTPAMFVNGRFYSGNLPYADIREVIEDELQRAKAKGGGK